MGHYFGTDGFRGRVGETLTAHHAFRIGRFLGTAVGGEHPRVAIGKDTRRSSYTLEYALAAGLTASGADAYLLHVIPTPGVSYVTRSEQFDCGIMISASHNPYDDNGIKLFGSGGEKMDEETLARLEAHLDGDGRLPGATGERVGVVVDHRAARQRYMEHLIGTVTASCRGLRVGLDCANGAAWQLAPCVFEALGTTVYAIHHEPDGLNINRDCGSLHMESLQRLVVEKGLDVGFAFDGDADRCLAVDERGAVVDGDGILYVMGRYMQERHLLEGHTVVTTVMSNHGLGKALECVGVRCEQTAVGDKYVQERMVQKGYCLGGEQSGHIIFGKSARTGDGILTALRLLERVCRDGPLSQLTAGFVRYPQVLKNLRVAQKEAVMRDAYVQAAVAEATAALGDNGRVLVRASGTEPVVRVMVEAVDPATCEALAARVSEAIGERGYLA